MGTAVETRDVLSKVPGVIRVHPNGVTGKTLVYVKDKNAVTEKLLTEAMEKTEKLRLRKMSKPMPKFSRSPTRTRVPTRPTANQSDVETTSLTA